MKRWILIISGLIVLAVASIYVVIPGTIQATKIIFLNGNQHGIYRTLVDSNKWVKWFPEQKNAASAIGSNNKFVYNSISYQPAQPLFDGIEVLIAKKGRQVASVVSIAPIKKDSTAVSWRFDISSGVNPFKRVNNFLYARSISKNLELLLNRMKPFLEDREHIYGVRIEAEKVKDTFLLTLKSVLPRYPEPATIYTMIDTITRLMESSQVEATNHPMMHVQQLGDNAFETMVAVPINRKLMDHPPILFKRMVAGNILVTNVRGGRESINNAFRQIENYIEDYKKVSPALPFESLVTNRLAEPDTSTWITKIYYPIYD